VPPILFRGLDAFFRVFLANMAWTRGPRHPEPAVPRDASLNQSQCHILVLQQCDCAKRVNDENCDWEIKQSSKMVGVMDDEAVEAGTDNR
jgi:hypothetical protein